MTDDAMQALTAATTDPDATATRLEAGGARIIRVIGIDAPLALLRASGFVPVQIVAPADGPTPRVDALLGKAPIGPRARQLLEKLLAPALSHQPILITHADEAQAQAFSMVRALARIGDPGPRNVHMLDLLHRPRASTRRYNERRIERLVQWLIEIGGDRVDDRAMAAQHDREAPLRDTLAQLSALRADPTVKLMGAEAARIALATTILPVDICTRLMHAILAEVLSRPGTDTGPRLFLTGSEIDGDPVHVALERDGAVVVGEDFALGLSACAKPAPCALSEVADPQRTPIGIGPRDRADAVMAMLAATRADTIVHISRAGDEAAAWGLAPLVRRAGNVPVRRFATDAPVEQSVGPPSAQNGAPKAPAASARSRRQLTSGKSFGEYHRHWFASVIDATASGTPLAAVNANAPQELFRALGINCVINQWWASIVAAKRQTRRYADLLSAAGYPADAEAYSAQGVAAALDKDDAQAPWGGLPNPDFVQAVTSTDATLGIFDAWAHESGARPYYYERSVDPRWRQDSCWWEELPDHWDRAIESERLDLMEAELREMVAGVEAATQSKLDEARLRDVLALVNEQEHWFRLTRDRIAAAPKAPVGIVDTMPATMVPQWHRGAEWARDAARSFHDEVVARIDRGDAAVADERVRLMWVGRGLWSDMAFYQRWEESHGAVFVWSMYLALAADGYIRSFTRDQDAMRSLAARFVTMGDELRTPCWAGPWHVREAHSHRVDGAIALADADPFVLRALTDAGIPLLALDLDNFAADANDADVHAAVTAFIEGAAARMAEKRQRS